MKNIMKSVLLSFLVCGNLFAFEIKDVEVVEFTPGKDHVEVKLKANKSDNSFFYVGIHQTDDDAFRKISFILEKIRSEKYLELNVHIDGISSEPSLEGSYFFSSKVNFSGRVKKELYPASVRDQVDEYNINGFNLTLQKPK